MKKKKGFTLIELLAVVVVLGLTFLFVGPKLVSLIKEGETRETELIEERILSAAKSYVNNIDGTFYTEFFKEGDTNYIYKTDLLKTGLITEEDLSKLDTIAGVKGELLEDDKMRYTIEYINVDPSEYTNEELYTMIQNLNDKVGNNSGNTGDSGNIDSSVIDDLQSQINENKTQINENKEAIGNINVGDGVDASAIQNLQSQIDDNKNAIQDNATLITTNTTLINQYSTNVSNLTNKSNTNNVFLKNYPVGSVYVSTSSTNPGDMFGGTWVSFGTGRTLVGVDASQTEFATVEKTGGEKTHTLTVNEMPSHEHGVKIGFNQSGYGFNINTAWQLYLQEPVTSPLGYTSNNSSSFLTDVNIRYLPPTNSTGGSQPHNNLQPYITVYMWKRTA